MIVATTIGDRKRLATGASASCSALAVGVGSAVRRRRGTEVDDQAKRLIRRTVATLDADDAAAERLIRDELEAFLVEARANVSALETLVLVVRERIAARATRTPTGPPGPPAVEDGRVLDQRRALFVKTSARDGALLVLRERGRSRLKDIKARMAELGHPSISNVSTALYKAGKADPPLVGHDDQYWDLLDAGRDMTDALLK